MAYQEQSPASKMSCAAVPATLTDGSLAMTSSTSGTTDSAPQQMPLRRSRQHAPTPVHHIISSAASTPRNQDRERSPRAMHAEPSRAMELEARRPRYPVTLFLVPLAARRTALLLVPLVARRLRPRPAPHAARSLRTSRRPTIAPLLALLATQTMARMGIP